MKDLSELEKPLWGFHFKPNKGCCMEENGGGQRSMPCLAQSTQSYTHSLFSPPKMGYSDYPKKLGSCKRKWRTMDDVYGQTEATSSAMERAREVEENLGTRFPSFVKPMIPSNVTGGFWLSLPKIFCKLHLPDRDTIVVLVDENGEEFHVKYLPERRGLSGGWRGFAIAHKLVQGDVLVFQLIRNYKFKVYIVRANCLDEVDGALSLLQLDAYRQRTSHGLTSETTSIADEVMACKLTSFPDDSALLDKSLTNFEQLRRNFELRSTQLDRLVCHAIDFKLEALQRKSVKESKTEPEYAKEPTPLEAKKLKLEEVTERLQPEVEVLNSKC